MCKKDSEGSGDAIRHQEHGSRAEVPCEEEDVLPLWKGSHHEGHQGRGPIWYSRVRSLPAPYDMHFQNFAQLEEAKQAVYHRRITETGANHPTWAPFHKQGRAVSSPRDNKRTAYSAVGATRLLNISWPGFRYKISGVEICRAIRNWK